MYAAGYVDALQAATMIGVAESCRHRPIVDLDIKSAKPAVLTVSQPSNAECIVRGSHLVSSAALTGTLP